jgi:hypothetical protein
MKKIALFSALLVAGLVASQFLPALFGGAYGLAEHVVRVLTMTALAFVMIHVGYEFEIDKTNLKQYGWDYVVAMTTAAFPWILVTGYFVYVMLPRQQWGSYDVWKETLLAGRFAAPTSAGVLFAMLAAAGLAATWLFRKARVLAIFDDLDTVLLMIPIKVMMVGLVWQLGVIFVITTGLLVVAWVWLHRIRIPTSWPWVLGYSAAITLGSEFIYFFSKNFDDTLGIHIEILLPAFALGCIMAYPEGADPHIDDAREGHQEGPESQSEQRVSTIISAAFMVLVGLSMPSILTPDAQHFSETPYVDEAELQFAQPHPDGEVGAGILIVSLSYGIGGPVLTTAMLSLALNLVLTGVFILMVKRLIQRPLTGDATS